MGGAGSKRILVVDDSVVVRRLMKELLGIAGGYEIESVNNGRSALEKLAAGPYDLILLDVEMPILDGLATLSRLRGTHPRLPVIMFSSSTEAGAKTTLDALEQGATDFFPKPSNLGSGKNVMELLKQELLPKVRSLLEGRRGRPHPGAAGPAPGRPAAAEAPLGRRRFDILAIASSTGGPNALAVLLPGISARLSVPVVIAQHMPPGFTRVLAERLERVGGLPVSEAVQGTPLLPGRVYVAPGNFHLTVSRRPEGMAVEVSQGPLENSCRPSADALFRSVAEAYGPAALAVVLTGMGQDGLRGCEALKGSGGRVLVQDEKTSVVWGMPGAVAREGLADEILPLESMGARIAECLAMGRAGGLLP